MLLQTRNLSLWGLSESGSGPSLVKSALQGRGCDESYRSRSEIICYYCMKPGHIKSSWPALLKKYIGTYMCRVSVTQSGVLATLWHVWNLQRVWVLDTQDGRFRAGTPRGIFFTCGDPFLVSCCWEWSHSRRRPCWCMCKHGDLFKVLSCWEWGLSCTELIYCHLWVQDGWSFHRRLE